MRTAILATALLACLAVTGCGSGEPEVDTAPFEAAVTTYLADHHMGMEVKEFRSLEISGGTATAICVLKEKSGLHNLGVKWRFSFRRNDARWQVREHKKL